MDTINTNRLKVELYSILLIETIETIQEGHIDPFGQHEFYTVNDRLGEELQNLDTDKPFIDDDFTYNNMESSYHCSTQAAFQDS